uniref:Uncharacterized protein n=1 Tax=Candidatus Kentrum sp. TC TaxID=2126339 RepID=A0A450Z3Y6_9GAMM|nr:MAG: hypothetical protein BECKTC1821D_GA0114238_106011 [Candidatus Kentron sp. TC]
MNALNARYSASAIAASVFQDTYRHAKRRVLSRGSRRQEHKAPMAEGREDLQGSKYDRLCDQANMMPEKRCNFRWLREGSLKTARA